MLQTDYIIEKDSSIGDGFHSIPNPVKGPSLIAQSAAAQRIRKIHHHAAPAAPNIDLDETLSQIPADLRNVFSILIQCAGGAIVGAGFHPSKNPDRDLNPNASKPKIEHHQRPKRKHRLTKVKAHPGLEEPNIPSSECQLKT
ncbi:hypothetical protein F2Q70_00022676 [Brassica cretica]|uniref:Uncharacterized protein n=1 Tax=Brassica cretica TaxID=69181 RepID=A0A8S9GTX5_BRACR|nr:hypothetical protein F2Q70_00022676 [Brassica cretica]